VLAPGERPPPLRTSLRGFARDLRALTLRAGRLAQAEVRDAGSRIWPPLAMIGAAVVLATAAFVAVIAAVVLALAPLVGTLGAALIVAAAAALAAVLLLRAAGQRLAAISFAPRRTVALLFGEDAETRRETPDGTH
jgi:hypothetical protein